MCNKIHRNYSYLILTDSKIANGDHNCFHGNHSKPVNDWTLEQIIYNTEPIRKSPFDAPYNWLNKSLA